MSKDFSVENEYLKVTVTTWGAQVKSVIRKCDNLEHVWNADKSVWGYHATILFPHAGKVVDGKLRRRVLCTNPASTVLLVPWSMIL